MTAEQAKTKLIAWALAQVGTREGENNWNKYAARPDIVQIYGWNAQNQPWCDIFVDVGFVECFGLAKGLAMTYQTPGSASAACRYSAGFYSAHGAFKDTPELGDQVFFYYDGGVNHTGIVVAISGGYISTVEGNSSDMVARRSYAIGSAQIAGYGRPNWALVADSAEEPPQAEAPAADKPAAPTESYCAYTYAVKVNLLKKGCYGAQVANMQHLLKTHGFYVGDVTGRFDDKTRAALMSFQRAAGISVDGDWGGESFKAMWNYGGSS